MNPITLKNRRTVFENTRFRVFADHVAGENAQVPDYLVVAPHTTRQDLVTGITVVPVWNGRIVLLRNYRHAVGTETLEGVRGFVDPGEDPAAAALREMEEEAGLTCAPADLLPLGICMPEASTLVSRLALFAATNCRPGGARDEEELGLGDRCLFTLEETRHMLPALEDVSTALALYRFLAAL